MSTQAPAIPPRPSRSPQQQQQQQQGPPPTSAPDVPRIPPRPNKHIERSMSPLRQSYAPSPLNEKPGSVGVSRTTSNDQLPRPSSVTIPSLGEEGIEYEDLNVGKSAEDPETRIVDSDLKIHAPKPSLPTSSAAAKVQAVTRTDSRQAAAAGIGAETPGSEEQHERPSRSLHSGATGSRAELSIASADHYDEEHGIPEIGQRVPMYPNAGDVQAPSPAPNHLEHGQRPGRSQHRTRSSREASLPPGSYGLHGHGVHNNDKFERAWYEKHPDEYAKEEQSQHAPGGTPKPDWALSSDDLNKIVRGSAVTGSGLGTSPAVTGTPEEEVGYMASDEYTQRMASPAPDRNTHPAVESPLRKMSHPVTETETKQENTQDSGVIHVDEPYHHSHHPDGFAPTPAPEEQAHKPGEGEREEEEPILAADEVRPESAFQHPAVSPTLERGDSFGEFRSRTPSSGHNRSNSRSTSNHGRPALARWTSRGSEREDPHTPLEDVAEYEPLFPEDENKEKKPVSTAERFKQRPELKHRFPSQDIWEDSPNSLQLHATVTTPDVPKLESFETPEQESIRRSQAASVDPHEVATHILESEDHKEKDTKRPSLSKHRFPSKDVWEDAPDSQQLVATVKAPEEAPQEAPREAPQEAPKESPKEESTSPVVPKKPSIPARPSRRPQLTSPAVDPSTKPGTSPTEKRQPPSIPDRPKPQIPVRPAKKSPEEPKDVAAKPKPPVPARPGGSKIAALKAGFLSDLNSRLQGGPPKSPEKKKEEEPAKKKPLQDARKGRARGPARRKPAPAAAPPTTAATTTKTAGTKLPTIPEVKIADVWDIWQINEGGQLVVSEQGVSKDEPKPKPEPSQPEPSKPELSEPEPSQSEPEPLKLELSQPVVSPMAPELSKNTAGEPTDPVLSPAAETPETELKKPEPAIEPVAKQDDAETSPGEAPATELPTTVKSPTTETPPIDTPTAEAPAVQPQVIEPQGEINKTSESSPESGLDKATENMAAYADGKRQSDGDIQIS